MSVLPVCVDVHHMHTCCQKRMEECVPCSGTGNRLSTVTTWVLGIKPWSSRAAREATVPSQEFVLRGHRFEDQKQAPTGTRGMDSILEIWTHVE